MDNVINFTAMRNLHRWIVDEAWRPLSVVHDMLEEYGLMYWHRNGKTVVFEYFDMTKPCWVISAQVNVPHPECKKFLHINGRSYQYFERMEYVDGYCELPSDREQAESSTLRVG